MSTRSRRPNGWSPTTVILIVLLLGAVIGASRLVTPPPPAPPVEVKNATDSIEKKNAMEKEYRQQQKKQMDMMKQRAQAPLPTVPKVADPSAVEIDNQYFLRHKPGEQGLEQVDAEVKRKTAAFEAYRRKVAAMQGKPEATKPAGGAEHPSTAPSP